MGQVRHGCATTTHAVRAAIQRSQASLATLSRELGINPKTVAKWRKRATVEDLKTGPKVDLPHLSGEAFAQRDAVCSNCAGLL
jgi:transposase-like protein